MNEPTREEALAHFGVPGMKWGVRNTARSVDRNVKAVKRTGKIAVGTGKAAVGTVKVVGKGAAGTVKGVKKAAVYGSDKSDKTLSKTLATNEKYRDRALAVVSNQAVRSAKLALITPTLAYKTGKKATQAVLKKNQITKVSDIPAAYGRRNERRLNAAKSVVEVVRR